MDIGIIVDRHGPYTIVWKAVLATYLVLHGAIELGRYGSLSDAQNAVERILAKDQ